MDRLIFFFTTLTGSKMKISFIALIILIFSGFNQAQSDSPDITEEEIKQHIEYLASDKLEGRFTGTEQCRYAADYIAGEFQKTALKPFFNGSYLQEFPFIAGLIAGENNSLFFQTENVETQLRFEEDFLPAPFTDNLSVSGEIVFAGYGISSDKLKYDDYASIDVKGKIVVVMRYSPEYNNPHSEFDEFSSFRYKTTVARDKGAAGIIFVNGHYPETDEDKLIKLEYDRGGHVKDIAAVMVKRSFIERLFEAEGLNFADYQKRISDSVSPASFYFKNSRAEITTDVKEDKKISWNVAALLPGNDPQLKNEYIVIGAHFDHLGWGETGSLYRGSEKLIHNGADDNASGTTGLLEISEKFALGNLKPGRSIIFAAFSGEELGLLGSQYFVEHLPVPAEKVAAMINMDMIGRLNDDNQLIVYGTGTSSGWKDVLNNSNKFDFKLSFNDEGYGPSDHSSFYGVNIPVLFFFTGTHSDYHRPSDDSDKINFTGEQKVLSYISDIALQISNLSEKPDYIQVASQDRGRTGGWKVYVGTIPDYASDVEGFKLSGVSEGGPAQKAGLKGGDIMISFGGKKITNIYDYVYALQEFAPGDVVDVVILRDGKEMTFRVLLEAR